MTIRRGGMLLSITMAAAAIATAVTAIVIVGQWLRRTSPAGMPRLLPGRRDSADRMGIFRALDNARGQSPQGRHARAGGHPATHRRCLLARFVTTGSPPRGDDTGVCGCADGAHRPLRQSLAVI